MRGAFDRHHGIGSLYALAAGGLLMAFAMWWLYFARPAHTLLATTHQAHRRRFTWAYGHYLIFASATAEGAGLAPYADHVTGHTGTSPAVAGAAVTVPAAVFLITVWADTSVPAREPRPSGPRIPAPRSACWRRGGPRRRPSPPVPCRRSWSRWSRQATPGAFGSPPGVLPTRRELAREGRPPDRPAAGPAREVFVEYRIILE
ncbi:low temperature requirement protein A [Streptomyces sp. NPDC002867]